MLEEKKLESIAKSLQVLALSKLAEELYTKSEREKFFHKITGQEKLGDDARAKLNDQNTPREQIRDFLEIAKHHDNQARQLKEESPVLGRLASLAKSYG